MRLLRKPDGDDWQAELVARSVAARQTDAAPTAGKAARRPSVQAALWGLGSLVAWASGAGVLAFGKHGEARWIYFVVVTVCVLPFQAAAARRRKRSREQELEPTTEERVRWELKSASHDLGWFLGRPTQRATYEHWLTNATRALEQISPELAKRWARPDRGRASSKHGFVSEAELDSRRRLLIDLYAEVASPDELAILTANLPQAPSARAITSS